MGVLPFAVGASILLVLHVAGAPGAPDWGRVSQQLGQITVEQVALVAGLIAILAVIVQPLQFQLLQLFEGYWNPSWPYVPTLLKRGVERHRRRRRLLEAVYLPDPEQRVGSDTEITSALWQLRHLYPSAERVLPTRLGNVLRASEDRAGSRYGLESIVVWPRLYPLLPDRMLGILTEQRNRLDLSVRMCAVLVLVAAAEVFMLMADPVRLIENATWLTVPAVTLLMAALSYRTAVAVAVGYGRTVETAFDLHRFDLIQQLHLPLPSSRTAELRASDRVSTFLRQAVDEVGINFRYQHIWRGTTSDE